ncbi:MAG: class I SAM-dependent methyltransferase, partial [Candidatus Micrarchaeota archaeon]|nr:class I SAM-dependent methyltransferase [Candidatus Micrarchaeota archaeon]
MVFVNTLPYISNPIEEFNDYKFVSWEKDIYPTFKGPPKKEEIEFFTDIIIGNGLRKIIDFGVGCGIELSNILRILSEKGYELETVEANETDDNFIKQAKALFEKNNQKVLIHKANWFDLPDADPPYEGLFDFAYLTGNSLTYIGGGTREYTKKAQQIVVNKFAEMIESGGYLFIDTRDYDYIRSLM